MSEEIIEIDIRSEDRAEFDRMVGLYGGGDPSAFLREVLRIMAARDRAEQLARSSWP